MLRNTPKPFFDASVLASVEEMSTAKAALTHIAVDNTDVAKVYIQIFDAVAATNVVLGTTTPDYVIPVLASSRQSECFCKGLMFKKGICYAATTTATGAVAPGAAASVSASYSVE
jgi:hypothetical protein